MKIFKIILPVLIIVSFSLPVYAAGLSDISGHKNETAIQYLYDNGIIQGYPDGTFQPDRTVNRAEILKILILGTNINPNPNIYNNCFPDVQNEWFAPYVCYAKEQGWVIGYPDGNYQPGQTVNKVEAIKIVDESQGYTSATINSSKYYDVNDNDWFYTYVLIAESEGLLEETGNYLEGTEGMTRGGISEMIYRSILKQSPGPDPIGTYDEEGRLTDSARSQAPAMSTLNLNSLTKLYPEDYGNNYFEPGTYSTQIGDGFGKDNFLLKLVDINDGVNIFEVFKKESDNNYYHFPTDEDRLGEYYYHNLFGITLELPEYHNDTIIYHPDCQVFFDYCSDPNSNYYAYEDHTRCDYRCPFNANIGETKVENDIFSVVLPENYNDLSDFSLQALEQCYDETKDFLRFDMEKPRIGLKLFLHDTSGPLTGHDEYVSANVTQEWLIDMTNNLSFLESDFSSKKCGNYLRLGHELTHVLTKEILGDNYGLNEGLADYVEFQNGGEKKYTCLDNGWKWSNNPSSELFPYNDLSTNPSDGNPGQPYYYGTGFCFWQDFVVTYEYSNFVKIMQQLYAKSRNVQDYYVLDVVEDIIGESVSQEILSRYSLNRTSTYVQICENCDIF